MLEIKELTVKAGNKTILNNLDLFIEPEEIHVIMGPNGVGKSTICKVLLGDEDYQITNGLIKYNDKVLNNLSTTERSRLGIYLLSQNPMTIEGVTNAEMLRTVLSEITNENVPIFEFNKKLESICQKLDIDKSFIHKSINENASGGERKKIELMHMWMLEPKLILLDELDSGLDVDALKVVTNSLNEYYQEFKPSILIITHHKNILEYIKPDKVHILLDGKISESGDIKIADRIENLGFNAKNEAFAIRGKDSNE